MCILLGCWTKIQIENIMIQRQKLHPHGVHIQSEESLRIDMRLSIPFENTESGELKVYLHPWKIKFCFS